MVKVPEQDYSDVITRAPLVHRDVGEIVAHHGDEGPMIDMVIKPDDLARRGKVSMGAAEARQLATELNRIADLTQQSGWTPRILAEVRQRYLPGMTDAEIMRRLDRLYEQWGGFVFGLGGSLSFRAGQVLAAESQAEPLDGALAVIDRHAESLSGLPEVAP